MEFRNLEHLSPQLNIAIESFKERLDMNRRDVELFYEIINFSYLEGKIKGSEIIINGEETKENING
jgi:hypothetical protein